MSKDAFDAHRGFERDGEEYVVVDATFEATAAPGDPVRVRVTVPTLDAAVVGETVADVVEDDWFRTFEARLDGLDGVTQGTPGEVTVTRAGRSIIVELTVEGGAPADDAMAAIHFVEGTWFQGVIPGYDYREDVQAVREQAHQRGGV
jgi:hypothetical protein